MEKESNNRLAEFVCSKGAGRSEPFIMQISYHFDFLAYQVTVKKKHSISYCICLDSLITFSAKSKRGSPKEWNIATGKLEIVNYRISEVQHL